MNDEERAGLLHSHQVEAMPVLRRDSDGRMALGPCVLRDTDRAWGYAVTLLDGTVAYPDDDNYEWAVKPLGVLRPMGDCVKCGQHGQLQDTAGELDFCVSCIPQGRFTLHDRVLRGDA